MGLNQLLYILANRETLVYVIKRQTSEDGNNIFFLAQFCLDYNQFVLVWSIKQ